MRVQLLQLAVPSLNASWKFHLDRGCSYMSEQTEEEEILLNVKEKP
jgi:hypothetical protein